ncbi:MAG: transporter, partial [Bacteroidales bacterium]
PLLVGFVTGKYLLKMNNLTLLGVMAGAMTSTPGLAAINSRSEASIAQIAYASVYPIALVVMILISNLLYLI